MDNLPDFVDVKVWVTLKENPNYKYYLVYNPHTYPGRIGAWDPERQETYLLSKYQIGNYSPEAYYWIQGYICGSEPDFPYEDDWADMDLDTDPRVLRWREDIELYHQTGAWYRGVRKCSRCGKEMLHSQMGLLCNECLQDQENQSDSTDD